MLRLAALRRGCLCAAAVLGGCGSWLPSAEPLISMVSPYRIDIQQGNVVTSDQMSRLKIGMNKLQVRDLLGTPLLNDPFHADRWDYVFMLARVGSPTQRRDVKLVFDGEVLRSIDAPELPTEREFVASVAGGPPPSVVQSLELGEEQLKALPVPTPSPVQPAEPAPPPRAYPPLEPS